MRLALLAVLCACAGAPPKPSPSDPLAELNRAARAAYAEARERALSNAGPVLIVGPARITLLHAGARSEFELSPARYHDLKAIAHFALGLHALHFQSAPDPARLAELRAASARGCGWCSRRGCGTSRPSCSSSPRTCSTPAWARASSATRGACTAICSLTRRRRCWRSAAAEPIRLAGLAGATGRATVTEHGVSLFPQECLRAVAV